MKYSAQQMKTRWGADDETSKLLFRAIRDQAKAADAAVSARRRSAVQQRRRSVYG